MKRGAAVWGRAVAAVGLSIVSAFAQSQSDNFIKHFKVIKDIPAGIDYYVGSKPEAAPFEKPMLEARQRLSVFLGNDLARGAVVVCSTLEQKDAVSEARMLRLGYRWVLIELTPEVAAQQVLVRAKAEAGGEIPPGLPERLRNRTPEMKAAGESRLVGLAVQRMAYATIVTTLAPEKPFRSSRADDMARSPLPDWIDVGLASFAVGGPGFNFRFLKDRIDEAFPLEDVLMMSRPFVAPASGGGGPAVFGQGGPGGGGGGAHADMPSPPPGGRAGGGGGSGRPRGGGMNLSKDVQDRMMFDAEASSFFSYLVAKAGLEKVKEIVKQSREVRNTLDVLIQSGAVDQDFDRVEQDWQAWLKEQKSDGPPAEIRMISGPERPAAPPR